MLAFMLGMKSTGVGSVGFLWLWHTPESTNRRSCVLTRIRDSPCKCGWFRCCPSRGETEHQWSFPWWTMDAWSSMTQSCQNALPLVAAMGVGCRFWRTLQTQTINLMFTDLLPISPTNKQKFKISLESTYMYALIFSHRILFLPMFVLRCLLIHSTDFTEHLLCQTPLHVLR